MSDLMVPDDATIASWIADWSREGFDSLDHYLARRGAIWVQQTRRRSLLERARDELHTVGLHEALGDFKLEAVREVVELYGSDN